MSEARELGVILTVTVDEKLRYVKQFVTADCEEEDGYISVKDVFFGKDVAFTLSKGLIYEKKGSTLPLRREVYDTDGVLLGTLSDLEFQGRKIEKVFLSSGVLSSPVVKVGEKMIVVEGSRKVKAKSPKIERSDFDAFNLPEKGEENEEEVQNAKIDGEKTSIVSEENEKNALEPISAEGEKIEKERREVPEKVVYGYEFLLGRKVTKSVTKGGTTIAEKGEAINADIVEKAGKEGKLVELTVNSI